jgi:hypothetical protein
MPFRLDFGFSISDFGLRLEAFSSTELGLKQSLSIVQKLYPFRSARDCCGNRNKMRLITGPPISGSHCQVQRAISEKMTSGATVNTRFQPIGSEHHIFKKSVSIQTPTKDSQSNP